MRIVFMGSPEFAVPALRAVAAQHEVVLVVSQPDKPAGRGRKLMAPAVVEAAHALSLPTYQPPSVRKPAALERLRAAGAELAVVVAYGKILPPAVLEAFPRGCINIHGSILPSYRGAAPIQRAIMAGETQTGVSIMQLDEGMDTGPVFSVRTLPIASDDTTASLSARLAELGAEALMDTLRAIEDGSARAVAQNEAAASHAAMLSKDDGRIDWSLSARLVSAHMRGVDPWPGATSDLAGETLRLFTPREVEGEGEPGTIVSVDAAGFSVACGQGACHVGEVQAPGKRRMGAGDFARGRRLEVGARFA